MQRITIICPYYGPQVLNHVIFSFTLVTEKRVCDSLCSAHPVYVLHLDYSFTVLSVLSEILELMVLSLCSEMVYRILLIFLNSESYSCSSTHSLLILHKYN